MMYQCLLPLGTLEYSTLKSGFAVFIPSNIGERGDGHRDI